MIGKIKFACHVLALTWFVAFAAGPASAAEDAQKAAIATIVDEAFVRWSGSWAIDTYSKGSADVKDVAQISDSKIVVTGTFVFTRLIKRHSIDFTATLNVSGGKIVVTKLSYKDTTASPPRTDSTDNP